MFKKLVLMVSVMMFCMVSVASATFMFSDVGMTNNSLTFTIDGDMTGYATPDGYMYFDIGYEGDIYTATSGYESNTWSDSVFDNKTIHASGNTGVWSGQNYSWSNYTHTLATAYADNRTITVSFGDFLDPTETGLISFYWGGAANNSPTLLDSVNYNGGGGPSAPVPEPATCLLLGVGLMGMAAVGRKKFNKS